MQGGINKKSPLWLARKRKGLEQKHLAHLLNQRNVNQISRYENSTRLPTLQTALALEIMLGAPARVLFADLYDQVQVQIHERAKTDHTMRELTTKVSTATCSFVDLFTSPIPTSEKITQIRQHSIELTNRLSELISDQRRELE
jgi:transcriptional regulator with XRE-family HTH domain